MGSANTTNGFDKKLTSQFVADIERLEQEQESKKGEYMAWCQRQRELINGYVDRAKDAGLPKRDLKAVLKTRKLERKIASIRGDLDDGAETFDMIRHALGDLAELPLGQAALDKKGGTDAIDALATGDDELEAAAPSNVRKLKSGIKQLQ